MYIGEHTDETKYRCLSKTEMNSMNASWFILGFVVGTAVTILIAILF